MKLFTYGSDTPLQLRGRINCQISYREESIPADIYVVSNKYSGCLLGKDTAEELRILKIDMVQRVSKKRVDEINGAYKWTKEAINMRYPSIVKGVD